MNRTKITDEFTFFCQERQQNLAQLLLTTQINSNSIVPLAFLCTVKSLFGPASNTEKCPAQLQITHCSSQTEQIIYSQICSTAIKMKENRKQLLHTSKIKVKLGPYLQPSQPLRPRNGIQFQSSQTNRPLATSFPLVLLINRVTIPPS